jgi:hypothetical protein
MEACARTSRVPLNIEPARCVCRDYPRTTNYDVHLKNFRVKHPPVSPAELCRRSGRKSSWSAGSRSRYAIPTYRPGIGLARMEKIAEYIRESVLHYTEQIFHVDVRSRARERRDRCVISLHPRLYRVTYLVILYSTLSAVQVHHPPRVNRWGREGGCWQQGQKRGGRRMAGKRVRASA